MATSYGIGARLITGNVDEAVAANTSSRVMLFFLDKPRVLIVELTTVIFDSYLTVPFSYEYQGGTSKRVLLTPVEGGDSYFFGTINPSFPFPRDGLHDMLEKDYSHEDTSALGVDSTVVTAHDFTSYYEKYCVVGNDYDAYLIKNAHGTPESYYRSEVGLRELRMLYYVDTANPPIVADLIKGIEDKPTLHTVGKMQRCDTGNWEYPVAPNEYWSPAQYGQYKVRRIYYNVVNPNAGTANGTVNIPLAVGMDELYGMYTTAKENGETLYSQWNDSSSDRWYETIPFVTGVIIQVKMGLDVSSVKGWVDYGTDTEFH